MLETIRHFLGELSLLLWSHTLVVIPQPSPTAVQLQVPEMSSDQVTELKASVQSIAFVPLLESQVESMGLLPDIPLAQGESEGEGEPLIELVDIDHRLQEEFNIAEGNFSILQSSLQVGNEWLKNNSIDVALPYRLTASVLNQDFHADIRSKVPEEVILSALDPPPDSGPEQALSVSSIEWKKQSPFDPDLEPVREFKYSRLYGVFSFSLGLVEHLDKEFAEGWHVELALEPIEKTDRDWSDFVGVSHFYFNSKRNAPVEFEIPTHLLPHGPYVLYARVFSKNHLNPVGTLRYPDLLTFDYGAQIKFSVSKAQFLQEQSQFAQFHHSKRVILNINVFEMATKDFRKPESVSRATIRVTQGEESTTYLADDYGQLRIEGLPAFSHVRIEVFHPDYFPTEKILPVFSNVAFTPIYLVPRSIFEDLDVSASSLPVVFGRVFDENRLPKAGAKFVSRSGKVLYPSARGNSQATSSNGLFMLSEAPAKTIQFNDNETGKPSPLKLVKNGFAYYEEWGRYKRRSLKISIKDGVTLEPLVAKLNLVGAKNLFWETNEEGVAEISGLDYSPTVLSFEVDARGYPRSLITISWDPKQTPLKVERYLLDSRTADGALKQYSVQDYDKEKATLFGAALSSFFERNQNGCFTVELISLSSGKKVNSENTGPFFWSDSKSTCISKTQSRFFFKNIRSGSYQLVWRSADKKILASQIAYVSKKRVTIHVNE